MKKLFSAIDEVEIFLTKYPILRDNDERLMANIWVKYIGQNELDDMDAKDLLASLANKLLPSYESISRCRRKLQEDCPNLRGEKWKARHERSEEIRKSINRETV